MEIISKNASDYSKHKKDENLIEIRTKKEWKSDGKDKKIKVKFIL